MAFTYVGQAVTKSGTFAAGTAFSLPSGTANGDLLTITVATTGNLLPTLPTGWTTRYAVNKNAEGSLISNIVRGYIVLGASAPADVLAGFTGSIRIGVVVKAYRPGVGVATFVDEAIGDMSGAFGTSHSWSGLSGLQTDDLLDMGLSSGRNITWGAADAVTDPSTASGSVTTTGMPAAGAWRLREADNSPVATLAWLSACGVKSSSGATGNFLMTTDINAGPLGSVLVFRDAAPAGPTINTQPSDQSVTAPATATFSVSATASGGSLTYQWRRNGTNISGANSASYTTPATSVSGGSANNGDVYSVVVTDSNGSVTSGNATLTVAAAPLSVTLDAIVDESGNPRATYTVDKIIAVRISDNSVVAVKTAQTTNGSGVLPAFSDAALTAVPHLFVTYTATGLRSGAKVYTPA